MISSEYKEQVDFLLDILPYSLKDPRMALKGGTAINLFFRNLERLSIDIDLTYIPLENRTISFKNIHGILKNIKEDLSKIGLNIIESHPLNGEKESKLFIRREKLEVKIEPNYILRGALFEPEIKNASSEVKKIFKKEVTAKCLNFNEIFGGKICAALDRQHPRDIFDIKLLLENEGIGNDLKDAFIYFLLSSNKPIFEILDPKIKISKKELENEFKGMTDLEFGPDLIKSTINELLKKLFFCLTERDRKFLISFSLGNPDWSLYKFPKISEFPSIRWKLSNIEKMEKEKIRIQTENLENLL